MQVDHDWRLPPLDLADSLCVVVAPLKSSPSSPPPWDVVWDEIVREVWHSTRWGKEERRRVEWGGGTEHVRERKDRTGKILRPEEKATDVRNNWPDTQPCMHLYSMNPTPPLCTTQSCCCCCCRRCWFLIAIVARKRSEGEGFFFSLLGCARGPPLLFCIFPF